MTSKNGEPVLVSLSQYMKNTTLNNPDIVVKDERITELDQIVTEVKQSEEWEAVKVSLLSVGIGIGKEEGRRQGITEGLANSILTILKSKGTLTEQIISKVKKEESATLAAPDYTYVGAIEYRCIPISYTSEVTRLMHLGYMSRYEPNAKYDMYGEYKNLATLAGIVTLIFSIPGAIASQAVQWLIWGLGLTATVGPFVIPQDTILNCQKTSYHWRLQDDEDSNRYTMFTGDRYIITEKTAGKTEYKDDFFYVPASYRNRDNDYALEMFRLLYGSMKSVRVSAWKPA